MAKFETNHDIWPVYGWADRAAARAALAPHGLTKMFDNRVNSERADLKERGVEGNLGKMAYEGAMRRFGMEVGPEAWEGPPAIATVGRAAVGKRRQNLNDDILWVYNSMEGRPAGGAPSAGAVGLLAYAKDNPQDFYRVYVPRLMAKVDAEKQESERFTDDGRPTDRLCDMIRERLHGVPEGVEGESGVPSMAERKGSRVSRGEA